MRCVPKLRCACVVICVRFPRVTKEDRRVVKHGETARDDWAVWCRRKVDGTVAVRKKSGACRRKVESDECGRYTPKMDIWCTSKVCIRGGLIGNNEI